MILTAKDASDVKLITTATNKCIVGESIEKVMQVTLSLYSRKALNTV